MPKKSLFLMITVLLLCCGQVFSSGFAIIEQSVSGLGNSFAGGAAGAEDAGTIFYNPAGMMLLEGQQVIAGAHLVMPSTKFTTETATNAIGTSLGSDNGGEGGVDKVVPNLYYANRISDRLAFGLGINAPFGLATKYNKTWVGRYHAIESEVMTININPAVAFKATDKLSFGFGVSAQYMDATLSSMVDGGLVVFAGSGYDMAYAGLVSNTAYDVLAENTADDWGYGYNLGMIYEFSESTRFGLAYRSEIKHRLEGEVKASVPAALLGLNPALAGYFQTQNINGSITLPATASISFFHQLTDKLALMADISWTQWSSFDELTINFEGSGIAGNTSTTTTENWDDTWRYAIGASYQVTESLLLRTGVAFDETPIPDEYRTPRIPGEDRIWLSLGAGYRILDSLVLDAAYAHLFVSDSKMEKSAANPEDASRGTVVGKFENSVDILSVQLSYNF